MPYARNADLPTAIRNPLPNAAQTLFRTVVNGQLNRGESEEIAFRSAWSAVGRQYKKPRGGGKWVHKRLDTLYVRRIVENADELIKWAKDQGFDTTQRPSQFHATVAYSKDSVNWPEPDDDVIVVRSHSKRTVEAMGDQGAVALKFASPSLHRRWLSLCDDHGCSWDHESYQPHITISWDAEELDLSKVQPYTGNIVLGPEVFEPVPEGGYTPEVEKREPKVRLLKLDKKLGIIFGWAIISKLGGEAYYDLQGDHIPEDSMLEASAEFMVNNRTLKLMHKGETRGTVVFAWPLTTEIAKAMGVRSNVTGLMIGVKPNNKKLIKDVEAGKFTGFSIGGFRLEDEDVA